MVVLPRPPVLTLWQHTGALMSRRIDPSTGGLWVGGPRGRQHREWEMFKFYMVLSIVCLRVAHYMPTGRLMLRCMSLALFFTEKCEQIVFGHVVRRLS